MLDQILNALTAGALAALGPTAELALKDAYAGLKALITSKFSKSPELPKAIEAVEAKPDSDARKAVLREELATAGADRDAEVMEQARALLVLVERHAPAVAATLVGQINAPGGKVLVIQENKGPITM